MFIPISTDYRLARRPWVNYAIIAINVIVFILGYRGDTPRGQVIIHPFLLTPDAPTIYQFFSSAFLHGGWAHLLGNMVFLWVFGNAVNDRFGHAGYLAFYLAGCVLAGVGYLLLSGHSPCLGASGAISAVTGAYLVLFPRVRVTLLLMLIYVAPIEVSSLYFLLFQFVFNLWMSLTPAFGMQSGGVAYVAHSSGYVFGIALALLLLATRVLPREPFDLLSLLQSQRRRSRYRRMVETGYNPFGPVSPDIRQPQVDSRWVETRQVETHTPDTLAAKDLQLRRAIAEHLGRNELASASDKYLQLIQIAEDAVLSLQNQLDIANYLMSAEKYPQAADAYERFLRHYSDYPHLGDIFLMLGLLYGRYLQQYDRAEVDLQHAMEHLSDPKKLELAQGDLQAVRAHLSR